MPHFEPTLAAARQCLQQVQPDVYARTRNALEGAVTHLSPYLTHGLLSLAEVYRAVHARHALHPKHKLVFELGWRAYYRHVWAHLGDGIAQSLHTGLLPDSAYLREMPADLLQARTGIPAIDLAVRQLYETGYVHNHARMWLASYVVHLRKVHWHVGAQWMLGYLLDGDVASNFMSWQWVAGTSSTKPYLFNADNVAKYAPAPWHSQGTAINVSYETMDALARSPKPICQAHDTRHADAGLVPPALFASPVDSECGQSISTHWCALTDATADAATATATSRVGAQHVAGRTVYLHHPWALGWHMGDTAAALPANALHIGIGINTCHPQHPWSAQRWGFVTQGLRAQTSPLLPLLWGSAEQLAQVLQSAKSVHWQPDPHIHTALTQLQTLLQHANPYCTTGAHAPPDLFEPVGTYCKSFSDWWRHTRISTAV